MLFYSQTQHYTQNRRGWSRTFTTVGEVSWQIAFGSELSEILGVKSVIHIKSSFIYCQLVFKISVVNLITSCKTADVLPISSFKSMASPDFV